MVDLPGGFWINTTWSYHTASDLSPRSPALAGFRHLPGHPSPAKPFWAALGMSGGPRADTPPAGDPSGAASAHLPVWACFSQVDCTAVFLGPTCLLESPPTPSVRSSLDSVLISLVYFSWLWSVGLWEIVIYLFLCVSKYVFSLLNHSCLVVDRIPVGKLFLQIIEDIPAFSLS